MVDVVHEDGFGDVSFEMYTCVMVIASVSRTSKSDSVYNIYIFSDGMNGLRDLGMLKAIVIRVMSKL